MVIPSHPRDSITFDLRTLCRDKTFCIILSLKFVLSHACSCCGSPRRIALRVRGHSLPRRTILHILNLQPYFLGAVCRECCLVARHVQLMDFIVCLVTRAMGLEVRPALVLESTVHCARALTVSCSICPFGIDPSLGASMLRIHAFLSLAFATRCYRP